MVNTYFFTDLDDTLVQSKHKLPCDVNATKISKNADDVYIGFSTDYQIQLLNRMGNNALVIPVTGRNKNALSRCDWTWDSYQVVSHGAVVLDADGELDAKWFALIENEIEAAKVILNDFMVTISEWASSEEIKDYTDEAVNLRIIEDQGVPAYLCGKQKNGEYGIAFLGIKIEKMLADMKLPDGWRFHVNGRNFAILPPYASKARAVRFVKEQLNVTNNDLTIGLGDSMSDLAFMNECHLWVTPSKGQINQFLQKQDHSGAK